MLVCGAQLGKTETILDIIGQRLDQAPAPILYVGPNLKFLGEQFEPRVMALLDEAPTLMDKVARGKRMTKTRKVIGGVPLRLAHAGSSTALKSDPAALALIDEFDEMLANVKGQGDPLGLVEARGDTYADFVTAVTSTPSRGLVSIEVDSVSKLEFWAVTDEDDLTSPIWRLWQQGTRHHWCWPCPQCDEYFVPRFKQLVWPKDATPAQARRSAHLSCPHCGGIIEESDKPAMNARGVYVAPGQTVTCEGIVSGEPPDTSTLSFWVSGLASPFVTIGARAEAYLTALASGESDKLQTAVNAGFGEVYAPGGGDVPEWQELKRLKEPYRAREVPLAVILLTAGIDVQGDRVVYVIRGWGARATSWLIDQGELWGKTTEPDVWTRLGELLKTTFDGLPVKVAFVDSGFRPGGKLLPLNRIYDFCRRFQTFVYPTKGSSTPMIKPLTRSSIEVEHDGKANAYGLDLIRLDPTHWKNTVHERLRYPQDQPGAFHIHEDATDDYLQQLVSEAPVRKPGGNGFVWVKRSRENHFLDAEALAAAAAYMLDVQNIAIESRQRESRDDGPRFTPPGAAPPGAPQSDRFANFAAQLNR